MGETIVNPSTDSCAPTCLAELTTFRIGGTFDELVQAHSEEEFIDSLRRADAQRLPLLVIGGGSNIVAGDEHFAGMVLQDVRREIVEQHEALRGEANRGEAPQGEATREELPAAQEPTAVLVEVSAGTIWDDFVAWTVERGYGGVEMLSGIPGTVGACPVQNIGAYGCEVNSAIETVRMWDRVNGEIVVKNSADMGFAYRDSMIKQSTRDPHALGELRGPTGRWVVLSVIFRLSTEGLSAPVRYRELAASLDVEAEERVPVARAREVVLALRRGKGMVHDVEDHDSWSAGSFFMNPIVSVEEAAALPEDAPRYPVGNHEGHEMVKTSAAWLITHAGFEKGYRVREDAPASLSTKHSLALTNRGGATCADIVELARSVQAGVKQAFGISLFPEPVPVGFSWSEYFDQTQVQCEG